MTTDELEWTRAVVSGEAARRLTKRHGGSTLDSDGWVVSLRWKAAHDDEGRILAAVPIVAGLAAADTIGFHPLCELPGADYIPPWGEYAKRHGPSITFKREDTTVTVSPIVVDHQLRLEVRCPAREIRDPVEIDLGADALPGGLSDETTAPLLLAVGQAALVIEHASVAVRFVPPFEEESVQAAIALVDRLAHRPPSAGAFR